jgi:flagellar basal body-associated protein FliL
MEDEIIKEEETEQTTTTQWIQDNLRIIISILIVVAIAGGIYSYSNRGEEVNPSEQEVAQEESTEATDVTKVTESTPATEVAQVASSQETENSFIETAGKGDGTTHLARRALANYLEKNQDSTLTAEHKIYIEDYLRKNVSHKGGIYVGTSIEFNNSLIQDAITKSKTLNEKQLTNLHKYAVRVPSLS